MIQASLMKTLEKKFLRLPQRVVLLVLQCNKAAAALLSTFCLFTIANLSNFKV